MKELGRSDAILFGAMGMPDICYPDGTEIAPQLNIRIQYELYAGVLKSYAFMRRVFEQRGGNFPGFKAIAQTSMRPRSIFCLSHGPLT